MPYPSVDMTELQKFLNDGHRLEKPMNDACCEEMYTIMLQCWKLNPGTRPPFSNLVDSLSVYLEAMAVIWTLLVCNEQLRVANCVWLTILQGLILQQ